MQTTITIIVLLGFMLTLLLSAKTPRSAEANGNIVRFKVIKQISGEMLLRRLVGSMNVVLNFVAIFQLDSKANIGLTKVLKSED